jgi:thioredoxin reductase (NADPH)
MAKVENIIIVGSGPAGLTAAIYASRALLEPLMIEGEEVGGQLMTTTDVENFPGFPDGIMGPELMEQTKKQAERFGTRFISKNVTKVDLKSRPFKVWIGETEYQSRSLIISTGATAKYLGLESERRLLGRGVSACATCDGAFFRDQHVLVIGGGDTAMEEATFLTRFASKVTIVHRRDEFRASKIMIEKALNNPKVDVIWNSSLEEVIGDTVVEAAKIKNLVTNEVSELKVEGIFIAIGHKPNTDLFKGQIDTNEVGYIRTDRHSTKTSVDGVFAAGDVADDKYRQAITAAGTGCMAAIDCERWLEENSHKS